MTIGEARRAYSTQIKYLGDKRNELIKQKEQLSKKINISQSDDKTVYENEAAVLELSLKTVEGQYEENREFMSKINEMSALIMNSESAKQQADAAKEYGEELGKILEVARRIGKGDKVPPQDEKKLMDYSMEMYMAAKNMAMINELKNKKKEKHDSLWDDEEEKTEYPDPLETADNTELNISGPELMDMPSGEA